MTSGSSPGSATGTGWRIPGQDWWEELDAGRPVVHVTQGTLANRDFDDLIHPTIDGLADDDVLVVVSTGGRPRGRSRRAAAGQRTCLPYDELLGKTDVLVTNGGVQFALRHGVPLVVAGDTEDKTEVCARVAWSGAGIGLWGAASRINVAGPPGGNTARICL